MKLASKLILILTLISMAILNSGYKRPDFYTIDSEKNAYIHNNIGLNYLSERIYYAAVQEFKIAISLSPDRQSSAIFYNNLGETYLFLGSYEAAERCFEDALKLYGLNFKYYINLVKCYKAQNVIQYRIAKYSQPTTNPLDRIVLGLLYIEDGQKRKGIVILDDFCMSEPDLIITKAVRSYLREQTRGN